MAGLAHNEFRDVVDELRKKVAGIQAVILGGSDQVLDSALFDSSLDIDTIASEYATLLRIARRASEDAGAGAVIEQILISEKLVMIARSVSAGQFLIIVCRSQVQVGRARYELRRAASEIQRRGQSKRA